MEYDRIMREQRRFTELLGPTRVESAIAKARKASEAASRARSFLPQTLIAGNPYSTSFLEQTGLGPLGGIDGREVAGGTIADYLRRHGALASGAAGGHAVAGSTIGRLRERHASSLGAIGRLGLSAGMPGSLAGLEAEKLAALDRRSTADLAGMSTIGRLADGLTREAALRAEVGAVARAARWSTGLMNAGDTLAGLVAGHGRLDGQIGRLTRAAAAIAGLGGIAGRAASLGALDGVTALKMSAFAGSIDLLGPDSRLGGAAFRSLIGGWTTRPDLPATFWRDPTTRRRMYRDADVDDGLVEADASDVVEVLIESGVVEGCRTSGGVRAVLEVGPLRMSITTGRPRHGAYLAIDALETTLRAFVAERLQAHLESRGENPSRWFANRVPGNVAGQAKRVRRDAYKAGEARQPLINFTNLGDLIGVITSKHNWDDVFGAVFDDREGFKVDLQRLNAHRRPTMHARPMDGPRLAEIVLTIRRMIAAMERLGPLDDGWDEDC